MKKKTLIFLILILNLALSLFMTENRFMDFKPNDIKSDNDDITLKLSAEQDIYDEWVRTWDSGENDYGYAIAMDSFENIYIAGGTATGPYSSLIVKYDKEGNYQWNQTWNTFGSSASRIALDSSDNIYILARSAPSVGNGIFLIKYNSTGNFQWYSTWDYSGTEIPFDLAIDSLDNIYVVGYSQINPGKVSDVLLVKYNSSGDQQWFRTWGGNSYDSGFGIAFDSSNDIFLTGQTESYGAGFQDMFLLKYNSSGTLKWNNTFGTDHPSLPDRGYDIILDSSDNIYVKGILTVDLVVVKYDHFGTYLWNKTYGTHGGHNDNGDIKVDSLGNIFMLAFSDLVKCNSSWDFQWITNPRGMSTEIALDSLNNVYIAGWESNGLDFDAILIKYSSKPKIVVDSPQIGDFFGKGPLDFSLSIYEPDVDNTSYSVDGGITKVPFTGSIGQIDQTEWDKLGHGTYNITFYINDTYGNEGFSKVEINKDITPPEFSVYEPISNSIYLNNPPNYSITVRDQFVYNFVIYNHLDSVWYTIDDGLINISITDPVNWDGTIDSWFWSNAPIGNITIRFYGLDDFGNIGFTEVIVEKRSESENGENGGDTTPPAIPGYNLIIIASMLSVIIVIILKKQPQK